MRFPRVLEITLALSCLAPAVAKASDPTVGHWLTENERAVVEISECEQSVCGNVYWIIEGGMEFDENNPLEDMKKRKICGLEILSDFDKEDVGEWESGEIYKADDGDTYKANLTIREDGTLRVRGYIGAPMFGKTQIWSRVSASDYKQCR